MFNWATTEIPEIQREETRKKRERERVRRKSLFMIRNLTVFIYIRLCSYYTYRNVTANTIILT